MEFLAKVRYTLALSSNNISDEVRNKYMNFHKDTDDRFSCLVTCIAKMIKNKDSHESIIDIIDSEKTKLELDNYCNWDELYILITAIISEVNSDRTVYERCCNMYAFINNENNRAIDFISEDIKAATYYSVLKSLNASNHILTNKEMSEAIDDYIDDNTISKNAIILSTLVDACLI